MEKPTSDLAAIHLSTAALPERDRVEMWRELFARRMMRVDLEPLRDRPLESEISLRALPGLRMVTSTLSAGRLQRRGELLADGRDDLTLFVSLGGDCVVSHRGRKVALARGEGVLMSACEPAETLHVDMKGVGIAVPRAALAPLVRNIDGALAQPIPPGTEALRLLLGYLKILHEDPTLTDPRVCGLLVTHIYDVLAVLLGATRDGAALAARRGLRAARLHAIKRDVDTNLAEPGALTIASIAARHRVTPRYIQMLFESEGTTFSDYVRNLRLDRARRMLADPRYCAHGIGTVAFACGFSDASYFGRAFRHRYGVTPSDVRGAARLKFGAS
jgi:AraC-like DNA-binding protein